MCPMENTDKMTNLCTLCSMPFNIKNRTQRPLKLCQKIVKNCLEYLTEDDLGNDFSKLNCKRKPIPFCSRCFATTEKLAELNDQLEDIRNRIFDLVESFKSEFLKSREIMGKYNSVNTSTGKQKSSNVSIKEEVIMLEGSNPGSFDGELLFNNEYADTCESIEFGGEVLNTSLALGKRKLDAVNLAESDFDSGSDKNCSDQDEDMDKSESSEQEAPRTKIKKQSLKRRKPVDRNSNDIEVLPDYVLKSDMGNHFKYKGHVVGAECIVLTCKYCHEDKRGKKGDHSNFRRHLKIKHAEIVDPSLIQYLRKNKVNVDGEHNSRQSDVKEVLVQRSFNMPATISNHYKYNAHVADTQSYILTCNYCNQDKRGKDVQNFLRHLKMVHTKVYEDEVLVAKEDKNGG